MKTSFTRFLCALCALALLLMPVAALAEGEQEPIEYNIGSNPKAWFVVPGSGFDTDDMYLNGIPYVPQLNQRNDIIMRTGDLLAAKVIGELPNVEPEAFQIAGGKISFKISVTVPDEGEAAPPPTAGAETETATVFAGNGLRTWLRSGPGGKRIRLLSDGTTVTVLSRDDGWCKVRIGNDTGYIMTKYLQFADNSDSDNLSNVQQVLVNANPFQLKGVTFELSDGQGNKQSIIPSNVWQSPIVKEVDPNESLPPAEPLPQAEPEETEGTDAPEEENPGPEEDETPGDTENPTGPESPENPESPTGPVIPV